MVSTRLDSTMSQSRRFIGAIVLVLALARPDPSVASFEDWVTELCSQTLELEACKNCILNDKSIGTDDVPRLTYSIVFCTYSQAVYGHDDANELAKTAAEPGHRRALRFCSVALEGAANRLWDTLVMMEGTHYYGAWQNLRRSRWSLDSCEDSYRKFAGYVAIPGPLLQDMTLAKRLFDVGQYFFHLILNVTAEGSSRKRISGPAEIRIGKLIN